MGVSADAPYLDSAYKLVAYAGRPVMKLSPGKVTEPGAKQVYRGPDGDVLALNGEPAPPGCKPLLASVMRDGRRLATAEPLALAQRRCAAELSWLPPSARALRNPVPVPVTVSPQLTRQRDRLAAELTQRSQSSIGSEPA
jgi:nicotinate phosphoribosyltransferase